MFQWNFKFLRDFQQRMQTNGFGGVRDRSACSVLANQLRQFDSLLSDKLGPTARSFWKWPYPTWKQLLYKDRWQYCFQYCFHQRR